MISWELDYTFDPQGKCKLSHTTIEPPEGVTKEEAFKLAQSQNPQIKFHGTQAVRRIYQHKPATSEKRFVWDPDVAGFVAAILLDAKFYVEGKLEVIKDIQDKYLETTGISIHPEPGTFNIAPEEKWGVEGTLYFDRNLEFPSVAFEAKPYKPGCVNDISLFWTLIRMGFRLDGNHEIEQILNAIPEDFREPAVTVAV
jgi:hypothetical protein